MMVILRSEDYTERSKMDIPANFPYMKAFQAGRPVHNSDEFSRRHPRMDRGHRAKIFAPFAALDGFGGAIRTKNIVYIPPVELSEDEKAELNHRLCILSELTSSGKSARANQTEVSVEYYVPCDDPYHDSYGIGGTYQTEVGICWRVDQVLQTILIGSTLIRFDAIRKIESSIFEEDSI